MNAIGNVRSYPSSMLSDDSDLASDIEADLLGLSIEDEHDNLQPIAFPSDCISVDSSFSPSIFSSTSDLQSSANCHLSDELSTTKREAPTYLRTAGLRRIFTQLLNSQLQNRCGSPCCIVSNSFNFLFALWRLSSQWGSLINWHGICSTRLIPH